ncbi:MAG: hypothetical protein ACP5OA_06910 [Candidatus Woesearchaeota archaeon]
MNETKNHASEYTSEYTSDYASDYINARKIAVVITIIILIIGSIIYFATGIAERNNMLMYKEIYGENATLNKADSDKNIDSNTDMNIKETLDVRKALV